MAFFKIAMVTRSDYAMLRGIIPDLPQTFDEWKLKQDSMASRHRSGGHKVQIVEFNPSAFAEWCAGNRLAPSEASLG